MQLGELQSQLKRFDDRKVSILALSVDPAHESAAMVDRLGLEFDVASDQNQRVIQQFHVQNPDTRELALHAVYIIDNQGSIYYRKVGLRRPVAAELIDAIDAHRGVYPQFDRADEPRQRINVAYPQNNFQALLALSADISLANSIDKVALEKTMDLARTGASDDAVFAFRRMIESSPSATEQELVDAAAWMTRELLLADNTSALATGKELRLRLNRVGELERALASASNQGVAAEPSLQQDKLEENLAKARAGLSVMRRAIDKNASSWRLRRAKTTLRSYRELARAGRTPKLEVIHDNHN